MQSGDYSKSSKTDLLYERLRNSRPEQSTSRNDKDVELSRKVDSLYEDVSNYESELAKLWGEFNEEVRTVEKLVHEQGMVTARGNGKASQDIERSNERLNRLIGNHVRGRQQSDNHLLSSIEQGVQICRKALAQQDQNKSSEVSNLQSTLNCDLPKLQEVIRKEASERESTHRQILENSAKILLEIEQDLQLTSLQRGQSSGQIKQMLDNLLRQTTQELEEESAARQDTQTCILALIENIYDKVLA